MNEAPSHSGFPATPEPPYYAVIFTSQRTEGEQGYGHMAERMVELAASQPGYLGIESVRGVDGVGITVSYWTALRPSLTGKRMPSIASRRKQGSVSGMLTIRSASQK